MGKPFDYNTMDFDIQCKRIWVLPNSKLRTSKTLLACMTMNSVKHYPDWVHLLQLQQTSPVRVKQNKRLQQCVR